MQLKPSEIYAVVRQLDDPYDSDTYYVQAKIRNAETDELIATLNLEDKGDQRFRKNWEVTADPSGEGFYIDIETIVYSDSGYTVVSDIYRRQNQVLLVQERNVPPFHGGGGGDVDYKKVKGAVEEAVGGQKKDKRYYRKLEDIGDAINELLSAVKAIEIPEAEKLDLSPVLERMEALQEGLKASTDAGFEELGGAVAEIPKEHVDLNPVLEKIESMKLPEFQEAAQKLIDQAREIVGNDLTTIVQGIKGLYTAIKGISFTAKFSPNVKEPEEEKKSELPARVRRFPMPKKKSQRGFAGTWILILASLLALSAFVGVKIAHGQNSTQESLEMWKATSTPFYAITPRNQLRNLYMPVGSATTSRIYSNTYCINNGTPDCITAWPTGGSGGGIGTTTPWTAGNLAQVVDNDTVTSIATSSLGLPTFTDLLSYLTLSAWYATTTDGLDEGSTNLYFTNARAVSALAGLYEVPLTFGDGLTRTVNDIDCDVASGTVDGCLDNADWTTFNNKQAAGNYITALTGEVTATGPGSVAATVADNIIDEANLKITGSPTDHYLLQASSTASGGFVWVSTTTLGITGGSIATPVSIADGGTNASSFTTTNGLVYFDGTSLVNSDLTWSPSGDTLDSGAGQALDILGQDGLFLDGQGASGLVLRSDGLIRFSSSNGSGGYLSFDTDALTVDRAIAVPDEDGTFALGTGSAGNCAEWSTTNTLTAAASPCGTGGGGSNWKFLDATTLSATTTNAGIGIKVDFVTGTSTTATSTFPMLSVTSAVSILGEYFTNFTTYVRSLFSEGDGLDYAGGAFTFDCTEVEGTGINCSTNDVTLDATGDWTGTVDGNNFAGGAIGAGDLLYGASAGSITERSIGNTGDVLSVVGAVPTWVSTSSLNISGGVGGSSNWTTNGTELFPNAGRSIEVPFFQATSTTDSYTVGNLGVGTTTPWGRLSAANGSMTDYTKPLFSVATSSDTSGQLFNVFATTTPAGGGTIPALINGARVVIGTVVNSFQNLFVNGTIGTSWRNDYCDNLGTVLTSAGISADTMSVCGFMTFDETTTATLNRVTVNAITNLSAGNLGLATAATNDGGVLIVDEFNTLYLASTTPVMEFLIGSGVQNGASSTTVRTAGFTNVPKGTANTTPSSGCYIQATSTSNGWMAVADDTSVSMTDTGISTTTAVSMWRISMRPSECDFYAKTSFDTKWSKVASFSSNIPSGSVVHSANLQVLRLTGGSNVTPNFYIYAVRYWRALPWQRLQF